MSQKISDELMGRILAECEFESDEAVAQRWGISRRTITRARGRLAEDKALSHIVSKNLEIMRSQWAINATRNLIIGLEELSRRYQIAASKEDAECIEAIAGALKVVGELKIADEALRDDFLDEKPSEKYYSDGF